MLAERVAHQNQKAKVWEDLGRRVKQIKMGGLVVSCEIDGEGKIIDDYLRRYAARSGQ